MDISFLERHGSAVALIDPIKHQNVSYATLAKQVTAWLDKLPKSRNCIAIGCSNSLEEIALYLAAQIKGDTVYFFDKSMPNEALRATHLFENGDLKQVSQTPQESSFTPTVESFHSIIEELLFQPQERAITSLALHHPFGLSLLNAVIKSGGSLVLSTYSVLEPEFWSLIQGKRCTMLPGTTPMYRLLYKIGFERFELPFLKTLLLTNSDLEPEMANRFALLMKGRGGRFCIFNEKTGELVSK